MKISRNWLQAFFEAPLPDANELGAALTFHAFEIESIENVRPTRSNMEDQILDVKVTPNRGHDCLSHRGIAKELSAILNIPLKMDPFAQPVSLSTTNAVSVIIDTPLCARYIAGYIRGVKVGPSPEWLCTALEAIGQRSINNVVDATNYVMFNMGQPLHAFDASQLAEKDGKYSIGVRAAKKGEKMLALDDKEYALTDSMLVISDENKNVPIGIAGVKGGKPAGMSEATKDIIIESANFDGVSVRRTAQALKLRTDASTRFEQVISPELAAYGMRVAVELIVQLTGGELVGFVDEYPKKAEQRTVSVSVNKVNQVLGTQLTGAEVANVFARLGFAYKEESGVFDVVAPFERLDLVIPEDLIEEVGRIIGYDKVPAVELPLDSARGKPEVNSNFYAAEHAREELMAQGYSEVYTSVFAEKGERQVLNKVGGEKPFLRANIIDGLHEALERNVHNKNLLGVPKVRLFEIGTVWRGGKEEVVVGTVGEDMKPGEKPLASPASLPTQYEDLPISKTERYQSFSRYPFIVRDIAMWVPKGADAISEVIRIFGEHSQGLLRHVELFDQFEKGERVSYAFHLVFQSFEKTLTDVEANALMADIAKVIGEKGWEVR
jgi:phenylalanyl-tRNA synthetase beta chain